MPEVLTGRRTHHHATDMVVFLIGFRINRLRAVRTWWPTVRAMPAMLEELSADPALGLLHYTQHLSPRGGMLVQYWRDLDSLLAYAHAADHVHRPAWAEFNRRARSAPGAVGIWHETLIAPAGRHESFYGDMPLVGMPKAFGSIPVTGKGESARGRLGAPRG